MKAGRLPIFGRRPVFGFQAVSIQMLYICSGVFRQDQQLSRGCFFDSLPDQFLDPPGFAGGGSDRLDNVGISIPV